MESLLLVIINMQNNIVNGLFLFVNYTRANHPSISIK